MTETVMTLDMLIVLSLKYISTAQPQWNLNMHPINPASDYLLYQEKKKGSKKQTWQWDMSENSKKAAVVKVKKK